MYKKGFSLIEFLIVLSIVVSLFSIISMPYRHFLFSGKRSSSFYHLLNRVEATRLKAKCYSQSVKIEFIDNRYSVICAEKVLKQYELPFNVKTPKNLVFTPKGTPQKACSVVFSDDAGAFLRKLVISSQGRIRYE